MLRFPPISLYIHISPHVSPKVVVLNDIRVLCAGEQLLMQREVQENKFEVYCIFTRYIKLPDQN